MKKRITVLICVLLASVMALMLTSCDGWGSMMDATTTSSSTTASTTESSTTSSTTSSSTSSAPSVPQPTEPKEYTAKDISDILNNAFTVLSEAMGEGEEDLSSFLELTDISIDNVINNGTDGLGFEKLYIKDGFTYSVSNGDVTIEKEKDGYVARIGSFLQVVEKLEEESSSMDMSTICIEELDITPNGSKKNSFVIAGDSLASLLNVIAGEELYDSATASALDATLSMTYFATNGNIIITVNNEDGGQLIIGVTYDYYDGVGKVAFSAGTTGMSQVITYTEDAAGAKKLEDVVTYDYSDTEKLVIATVMESKGESYVVPEGTDHKSCDSEIYEVSVKQGNKSLVTVKLNAAMIGNTIRGYADIYMGEDAPDTGMGGIGLMSASSDTNIEGTFDIVIENEEIISAVANFDMEYYLISGDVSIIYNAQDMKTAGKTPVSITVRDNNLTTTIKLDTVSYEAGQGIYTLTITEPDGTLTANVALPAIKNFELTEKEQLYLERADLYLENTSRVDTEIKQLGKGAVRYASETYSVQPYIVTRSNDGKRCYITCFYSEGGALYYDIYISLDFELAEYIYVKNKGSLSYYSLESKSAIWADVMALREIYDSALGQYYYPGHKDFIVELYNEELGIYVYFKMGLSTYSGYTYSYVPYSAEELGGTPHRMDKNNTDATIFDIHSTERMVDEGCCVYYLCEDCGSEFQTKETEHVADWMLISELTESNARVDFMHCERCGIMELCFTDSQDNKVYMEATALSSYVASSYGIEGSIKDLITLGGGMRYEGEGDIFDRAISIPDITVKTGKTIVGIETFPFDENINFTADLILPEGIVFLARYSLRFYVSAISLPSTLKYVGEGAFDRAYALTELTIPESVEYFMPQYSFTSLDKLTVNAKNLKELYIPLMRTYNIEYNTETIEKLYFRFDLQMETVEIPEGTKLFYNLRTNPYVKKIIIPSSIDVSKLDYYSIGYNPALKEVILSDAMTSLLSNMFKNCTSLTTVKVMLEDGTVVGNDNEVRIPSRVKTVCGFEGCASITRVILPDGLLNISGLAFSGCTSLVYVQVPNSVESIGTNAFNGCTSLGDEGFTFGTKLKQIGNNAFLGTLIKNVTINYDGEDTVQIDYSAFNGMSLKNLTINAKMSYLYDVSRSGIQIETLNVNVCAAAGSTYGLKGTKTVNITYKDPTTVEGEPGKFYIHEDVETVNFSGTKEEFEALNIHLHNSETVINYNVVFE